MVLKNESKRAYLSFMLFNFAFFMMDTTTSYFTIYLNEIGLSKSMIGIISGTAGSGSAAGTTGFRRLGG